MLPKHLFDGILTLLTLAASAAVFISVTLTAAVVAAFTGRKRAQVVALTSGAMAAIAGGICLLLGDFWQGNIATTDMDWRDWGAPPAGLAFIAGLVALFRVR